MAQKAKDPGEAARPAHLVPMNPISPRLVKPIICTLVGGAPNPSPQKPRKKTRWWFPYRCFFWVSTVEATKKKTWQKKHLGYLILSGISDFFSLTLIICMSLCFPVEGLDFPRLEWPRPMWFMGAESPTWLRILAVSGTIPWSTQPSCLFQLNKSTPIGPISNHINIFSYILIWLSELEYLYSKINIEMERNR